MTAPLEDSLATAVLALVNTRLASMATPRHAYEADDAPTTGGDYIAMTLTRRFGGNGRLSTAKLSPSAWRVVLRSVGVGVTNARVLMAIANDGIEDKRVTVGGETSTKFAFETEDPIGEDEFDANLWSSSRAFTFSF